MGWSVLIARSGVEHEYTSIGMLEFVEELYDIGVANIVLTGLDGKPAPATNRRIRIVWDYGLATQQVHWEGVIEQADKKGQGNMYAIRAYTAEIAFHKAKVGPFREFTGMTPYQIMVTSVSPPNLNTNLRGFPTHSYGTSAFGSVIPNRISSTTQGAVLDRFVAHSGSLFQNIKRLCLQSRYGDGSYGLEWVVQHVDFVASMFFYLVKRRERAIAYTPEVFNIPADFIEAKRGNAQVPSLGTVRVIGAGTGSSRIESATVGSGSREEVFEDKAIFDTTNADNMANRLLEIFNSSTELIMGSSTRHRSPSRCGDTVTVTQAGFADKNLRVMLKHYSLETRHFTYVLGRPAPIGRDHMQSLLGIQNGATTTPQFGDKSSVAGDEPLAINGTPVNVVAGNAVFGAWTTLYSFTPAASFDCDYIDALLVYYNNASNVHDADLEVQLVETASGAPMSEIFAITAQAPAPQDANDTVAVLTTYILAVNNILEGGTSYSILIRAKDVGGVGGFTDAFRTTGKIVKQHRHDELR
jgi:hypothetical protein